VAATTAQLLRHLQATGALQPALVAVPRTASAEVEDRYATYLRDERGLCRATLLNYILLVHRFLVDRFGQGLVGLGQLRANDAPRFVLRHAPAMSPGRAKLLVTAIRSCLRFLHLRGETATDLAPSVPSVTHWRLAGLPRFIPVEDVHRLLRACDRHTATGRRDYAVMLLLARLGLRAGEVVQMTLDDIDWDGGEVTIRSKGGRHERLPIPDDVGEALVEYLRRDRARCTSRRVFICATAPHRGFSGSRRCLKRRAKGRRSAKGATVPPVPEE
jgi:integrase/recombinase XerD